MSTLPKHHKQILSNGLEVYVVPLDNGSDVISTNIFYNVGSRDEILGKTGIAHMLEHMNFKSSKNLAEGEFDSTVKSHGGVNNASTGFDYTHYFINSSSAKLSMSLGMYAELMQNLNLNDDEFQKERDVVAEERRWRTDNNPIGYLYFRLFNAHFISHSYHWTPIGFMEDILTWNIEDIREFHANFYRPSNAILVITGDIKPDDVFTKAKKYFEQIPNPKSSSGCSLVTSNVPHEVARDSAIRVTLQKPGNLSDTLAIAYTIPDFMHEDQVSLSVISELLSAGKSSRLHQELVNTSLVSQVYGYNMELKDSGVFIFLAVASPDVGTGTIEEIILTQIQKIKDMDISTQEIDKVKINTKRDFLHSIESSSSLAGLFGSYLSRGCLQPLLEYEEKLDKITPKILSDVASRYFDNSMSTTIIMPKEQDNK